MFNLVIILSNGKLTDLDHTFTLMSLSQHLLQLSVSNTSVSNIFLGLYVYNCFDTSINLYWKYNFSVNISKFIVPVCKIHNSQDPATGLFDSFTSQDTK